MDELKCSGKLDSLKQCDEPGVGGWGGGGIGRWYQIICENSGEIIAVFLPWENKERTALMKQ